MMNRDASLKRLRERAAPLDIAIIGGGATGVGIAVDAASRGYAVALLEQADFGKGTSSRSTKLIHGGVRYLQQGNVSLVMESLKERGILRSNAPHLVHDLAFVVPNYAWWETPFYGIGMRVYDLLAGKFGFGKSRLLSKTEVLERIPTLETKGLRGGVLYYDGQFDDTRLLIDLAHTAEAQGAALLNYAKVTRLTYDEAGFVSGLEFTDAEALPPPVHALQARCVINATGPFTDAIRKLDDPEAGAIIAPSQGVHLVLDRSFLPGDSAIMVPHTADKRVMFAIPWRGHTLLGTTDTPVEHATLEPVAQEQEIDFILRTAAKYLRKPPTRGDVLSVFAGIRPLFRTSGPASTSALSRDHSIQISKTGLLTIAGGKWTTYRKMAEDAVNHAITLGELEERPCVTGTLKIHGASDGDAERFGELRHYGSAAVEILQLIAKDAALGERLHPDLPIVGAEVLHAVRCEMARTLEDVLARRTRALFLNARAALAMAEPVARLMAVELGRDERWAAEQVAAFGEVAGNYLLAANAP